MPSKFRALTQQQFLAEVAEFDWQRRVWRIDMHHTFRPDHARWREIGSAACVEGMRRAHVEGRGFADIAQHVSIMPDGEIWTGRDWNMTPASVGSVMNLGVFMLEAVGNFDMGADRLEGAQLDSVITVIRGVQRLFGLPPEALLFHREVPQTDKTCPGNGIEKADIVNLVRRKPMVVRRLDGIDRLPLDKAGARPGPAIAFGAVA